MHRGAAFRSLERGKPVAAPSRAATGYSYSERSNLMQPPVAEPPRLPSPERLRRARCGMIEVVDERLVGIRPRLLARRASRLEVSLWGRLSHRVRTGNQCWLYYRQPRSMSQFLIVEYALSARGTSLGTIRGALGALDEVARLKQCDAILCDVASVRISDRLLRAGAGAPMPPRHDTAISSSASTANTRPQTR